MVVGYGNTLHITFPGTLEIELRIRSCIVTPISVQMQII